MISSQQVGGQIPEEYRTIFLREADQEAGLAICLLVRKMNSPGPAFILLREGIDATIYLGCIVDRTGDIKSWVEIWVQNLDRMAASFRGQLEPLTNALMDRRWTERAAMFRTLDRSALMEIGWESEHPVPSYVDPAQPVLAQPIEAGRPFRLCTDEASLGAAGLPPYASSLHRYLWNGPQGTSFVAVTSDAPTPKGVRTASEFFGDKKPFNPGGGFLLVRLLVPLKIAEFADILGGKPWAGFESGREDFSVASAYAGLKDPDGVAQGGLYLFNGRNGRAGRLLEVFHLKLNLVRQVLIEIRAAIRIQQLPFLNLTAESFSVKISQTGTGLPSLWTAKVGLAEASSALPLNLPTNNTRYFLPPELPGPSIYRPQSLSLPARGLASVRIRKVLPPTPQGVAIEATLSTDERLNVAASDLIHVRLTLPIGRIDLYGHVDQSQALAKGETRFRTLPQTLPASVVSALELAAGAPVNQATFEVLPLLSTPCDLYAAAVLAVRILLVDEENSLPVALDEILSLARQTGAEFDPKLPFLMRLRSIIESDPRWRESLSPKRLVRDAETRKIALDVIPGEVWWDLIGLVIRLFPGTGPDSHCRDLGDAPSLALDRIFEEAIEGLEHLQLRTRSLVVADWNQNIEIHDAIYALVSKYGA